MDLFTALGTSPHNRAPSTHPLGPGPHPRRPPWQDMLNDNDDHALVDFIWERRRETWVQLRRFEDVVQRQFEELRSSLVNRHGSKRDMQPTPASASLPRS